MADSNSTNNESGDDGDKPNKLQTSSSPSPSSQNNADKPHVFLSNNFHNYRMMKQQQQQRQGGEKGQESNNNSGIESKNQPQQHDQPSNLWKHFLAPLTPQPKNETETSPPTAQQTKHQPSSAATGPPIFSDLERSQTVDRFSNLFMKHMGDAMSSNKLSQAWQGNSGDNDSNSGEKNNTRGDTMQTINTKDYSSERSLMQPHLTPMIWGSSCMVITLFSLRFGRWYGGGSGGRAAKTAFNSTNKSDTIQKSTTDATALQDLRKNPFNPTTASTKSSNTSPMASLHTLPVDMSISLLVGISTTIFLTDSTTLMKDFSKAPLLEGKSVLTEELCIPFRREMKKVNRMHHQYTVYNPNGDNNSSSSTAMPSRKEIISYKELWNDDNLGEFDSLRAIRDFVDNCHRREVVAKEIIGDGDEDGMSSVDEESLMGMKIPPPGISPLMALDEYFESDDVEEDQFA